MRLMGWRSEAMLSLYGASAADHRAMQAANGCAGVTRKSIGLASCRTGWRSCSAPATGPEGHSATRGEAGSWTYKERGRGCCCAPPPVLPEGTELAEMVAAAWDEVDTRGDDDDDGRAPVRVRR